MNAREEDLAILTLYSEFSEDLYNAGWSAIDETMLNEFEWWLVRHHFNRELWPFELESLSLLRERYERAREKSVGANGLDGGDNPRGTPPDAGSIPAASTSD